MTAEAQRAARADDERLHRIINALDVMSDLA